MEGAARPTDGGGNGTHTRRPARNSADGDTVPKSRRPKFVYLYSNPLVHGDGESMLDLDLSSEIAAVHQALAASGKQVDWMQSRAVKDRLVDVTTMGCTLVHWAGHGHKNALVAEDEWGRLNEVSPDILQSMCQRGVSVAIITSCFSEFAGRAFVNAGVPHVVAVRGSMRISSYACKKFTHGFYLALLSDHTVQEAFDIGVSKVRVSYHSHEADGFILLPEVRGAGSALQNGTGAGSSTAFPWEIPKLLESDVDPDTVPASHHDVRCLGTLAEGRWSNVTKVVEHMHPFPPSVLVPRKKHTFEILKHFAQLNRVVVLTGPPGIGKHTIAQWTCEWLKREFLFPDGIFWINCGAAAFRQAAVSAAGPRSSHADVVAAVRKQFRNAISKLRSVQQHSLGDADLDFQRDLRNCHDAKFLLVLARWDALPEPIVEIMRDVVAQFMDHTRNVKILVTCRNIGSLNRPPLTRDESARPEHPASPPYKSWKGVVVGTLSKHKAATLLLQLLPRVVTLQEIESCSGRAPSPQGDASSERGGDAAATPQQKIKALEEHRVMEVLDGNPRNIVQFAAQLSGDRRFAQVLSDYEKSMQSADTAVQRNPPLVAAAYPRIPHATTPPANVFVTQAGHIVSKSVLREVHALFEACHARHEQGSTVDDDAHELLRRALESQLKVAESLRMDASDWESLASRLRGKTRQEGAMDGLQEFLHRWKDDLAKHWHAICEIRVCIDEFCNEPWPDLAVRLRYICSGGNRLAASLKRRSHGTFAFRCSSSNPAAMVLMWTDTRSRLCGRIDSGRNPKVEVHQFHFRFVNGFSRAVEVATQRGTQTYETLTHFLRAADYLVKPLE